MQTRNKASFEIEFVPVNLEANICSDYHQYTKQYERKGINEATFCYMYDRATRIAEMDKINC